MIARSSDELPQFALPSVRPSVRPGPGHGDGCAGLTGTVVIRQAGAAPPASGAAVTEEIAAGFSEHKTQVGMPEELIQGREALWTDKFIDNLEVKKGSVSPAEVAVFAGHWIYEEHPAEMTGLLLHFLKGKK